MTSLSESLVAEMMAGVYKPRHPPEGVQLIRSGGVKHVQFEIYRDEFRLYVIYAGSNERRDWARHTHACQHALPDRHQPSEKPTLKAHGGWLRDAHLADSIVWPELRLAIDQGYSLVFGGHSYGKPLAELTAHAAAIELHQDNIAMRSIGGPATGNKDLAASVNHLIPDNIRYANPADIVTYLPVGRYHHSGKLVKVSAGWPGHSSKKYRDWIIENESQPQPQQRPMTEPRR